MKNVLLAFLFFFMAVPALAAEKETAFDRVLKTQTIRCGYIVYPPYFIRDINTNKMSGIFYDLMEEIGKNSGLKIEWVEEVGYDSIFTALDTGRFEVFAGGLWPSAERAKAGYFGMPAFYSGIMAWGRNEEKRFSHLDEINDSSVRIAVLDGSMEDLIARMHYPKAQRVSLPQMTSFVLNFQNIVDKKADVTFAEPSVVHEFMEKNPKTIKRLGSGKPLRIFANSLAVGRGEVDLKQFLDVAMQELIFSGEIDRILTRYEKERGLFLRAGNPYQTP